MLSIINSDCLSALRQLPDASVQCCVTSPPYWGLRDYGHKDQLGAEKTFPEYIAKLVAIFSETKRVLKPDGTLWLNLGDCYARNGGTKDGRNRELSHLDGKQRRMTKIPAGSGLKPKDLVGIPWRVAFALQDAGWWLREDIIWAKPNCMPESVTDRCTRSHEYIFHLSKAEKYYHDADAIKEPATYNDQRASDGFVPKSANGKHAGGKQTSDGRTTDKQKGHGRRHDGFNDRWDEKERNDECSGMRNKRSVWTVPPANYPGAHFATFPPALITPCILAATRPGDTVLDPFGGSGTTGEVALTLGRRAVIIELNPDYCALIRKRCEVTVGLPLT